VETLILIALLIITLLNYGIENKPGYPPVLFSGLWFLICLFHWLAYQGKVLNIYPLSLETLLVFTTGVIFFSVGSFLALWLHQMPRKNSRPVHMPSITHYLNILLILSIIGLPFFFQRINELASTVAVDNFFAATRYAISQTDGDETLGIWKYFVIISVVSFVLRSYYRSKTSAVGFWLSFALAIAYMLLFTGRTLAFMILTSFLGLALLRPTFSIRQILIFSISGLSIFIGGASLLNKTGGSDFGSSDFFTSISEIFVVYLLGSLPAFSGFLRELQEPTYGQELFRTVYVILYKVGITTQPPADLIKEFTNVPFSTNVYTIFQPYIQDFGYFGLVFMIFIGYLNGYVYVGAFKRDQEFMRVLYCLLMYPIFMSFFQDQYFSLLSMWVQILVILSPLLFLKQSRSIIVPD
jgi:oligosaccharide repeat unit polymerase